MNGLASRSKVQARDIFDLHLLLASGAADGAAEPVPSSLDVGGAVENALSVSFDVFRSQVLSFLAPDHRLQYDDEDVWSEMVLRVVEALEGLSTADGEGAQR